MSGGGGGSVSGRRHDNVFPQRTRPGSWRHATPASPHQPASHQSPPLSSVEGFSSTLQGWFPVAPPCRVYEDGDAITQNSRRISRAKIWFTCNRANFVRPPRRHLQVVVALTKTAAIDRCAGGFLWNVPRIPRFSKSVALSCLVHISGTDALRSRRYPSIRLGSFLGFSWEDHSSGETPIYSESVFEVFEAWQTHDIKRAQLLGVCSLLRSSSFLDTGWQFRPNRRF